MVEIWEQQKGESTKAYQRFKIYRELPAEIRTIKKVHEEIEKKYKKQGKTRENDSQNNKIPSLKAIEDMSMKWSWVERADIYERHKDFEDMLKSDEEFKEANEVWRKLWRECLDFAKEIIDQLINNPKEYALSTRVNMFNSVINTMDKVYRNFRLSYGRSTKINETSLEHEGKLKLETKEENDNVIHMKDKELEELLTINDDLEKFTDEL